MRRRHLLPCCLLLLGTACDQQSPSGHPGAEETAARMAEVDPVVQAVELDREVIARLAAMGDPVPEGEFADPSPRTRRLVAIALGRIGGRLARERLLAMLTEDTGDREADGPTHLYAAAGLTLLRDPGTAVDLVLALSYCNPDDNIAALASEERSEEYYTVDAQICDALLSMGMFHAEKDLVLQLRRRHRIRVLIDAYAVLRRHSGLDLSFRYNGSYDDRLVDADAWLAALRASREERERARPFDRDDAMFRRRCDELVAWLGQPSVNYQLIAHKALSRIGPPALPSLLAALGSDNRVWQRQGALALGRLGDDAAVPGLRAAVGFADPDARSKALDALRLIGDAQSAGLALPLLKDPDAGVRSAAARYIGRFGDPKAALGALGESYKAERAPGTRTAFACALFRLGDEARRDDLVRIFVEGEQLDRQSALDALLESGPVDPRPSALAPIEDRRKQAEKLRKR